MANGRRVIAGTAAAVAALTLVATADLVVAVRGVDRVAADPAVAHEALGPPTTPPAGRRAATADAAPDRRAVGPTGEPTVYLVVGSDARPGLTGARADVLMLGLLPPDTSQRPALVSLPRDLWVDDLCHGGRARLNAALNGCGEITGAQLLGATVEHVTGVRIDHYAEIDLVGFEAVVAGIGGIEVCTRFPTRDLPAGLDLPGGCLEASPAQVLAWVRARHLEELRNGRWRPVAGSSDLLRNRHQQETVLQVLGTVADLRSPWRLRRVLEPVLEHVTLGESLGVDHLLELALTWRHVDPDAIARPRIEVVGRTTAAGAQVLDPVGDLRERFAQIVADLAAEEGT